MKFVLVLFGLLFGAVPKEIWPVWKNVVDGYEESKDSDKSHQDLFGFNINYNSTLKVSTKYLQHDTSTSNHERRRRQVPPKVPNTAGLEKDTDDPDGLYRPLDELRAMKPGPGVQYRDEMPVMGKEDVTDLRKRKRSKEHLTISEINNISKYYLEVIAKYIGLKVRDKKVEIRTGTTSVILDKRGNNDDNRATSVILDKKGNNDDNIHEKPFNEEETSSERDNMKQRQQENNQLQHSNMLSDQQENNQLQHSNMLSDQQENNQLQHSNMLSGVQENNQLQHSNMLSDQQANVLFQQTKPLSRKLDHLNKKMKFGRNMNHGFIGTKAQLRKKMLALERNDTFNIDYNKSQLKDRKRRSADGKGSSYDGKDTPSSLDSEQWWAKRLNYIDTINKENDEQNVEEINNTQTVSTESNSEQKRAAGVQKVGIHEHSLHHKVSIHKRQQATQVEHTSEHVSDKHIKKVTSTGNKDDDWLKNELILIEIESRALKHKAAELQNKLKNAKIDWKLIESVSAPQSDSENIALAVSEKHAANSAPHTKQVVKETISRTHKQVEDKGVEPGGKRVQNTHQIVHKIEKIHQKHDNNVHLTSRRHQDIVHAVVKLEKDLFNLKLKLIGKNMNNKHISQTHSITHRATRYKKDTIKRMHRATRYKRNTSHNKRYHNGLNVFEFNNQEYRHGQQTGTKGQKTYKCRNNRLCHQLSNLITDNKNNHNWRINHENIFHNSSARTVRTRLYGTVYKTNIPAEYRVWMKHIQPLYKDNVPPSYSVWLRHVQPLYKDNVPPSYSVWLRHIQPLYKDNVPPSYSVWLRHTQPLYKDNVPPSYSVWLRHVQPLNKANVTTTAQASYLDNDGKDKEVNKTVRLTESGIKYNISHLRNLTRNLSGKHATLSHRKAVEYSQNDAIASLRTALIPRVNIKHTAQSKDYHSQLFQDTQSKPFARNKIYLKNRFWSFEKIQPIVIRSRQLSIKISSKRGSSTDNFNISLRKESRILSSNRRRQEPDIVHQQRDRTYNENKLNQMLVVNKHTTGDGRYATHQKSSLLHLGNGAHQKWSLLHLGNAAHPKWSLLHLANLLIKQSLANQLSQSYTSPRSSHNARKISNFYTENNQDQDNFNDNKSNMIGLVVRLQSPTVSLNNQWDSSRLPNLFNRPFSDHHKSIPRFVKSLRSGIYSNTGTENNNSNILSTHNLEHRPSSKPFWYILSHRIDGQNLRRQQMRPYSKIKQKTVKNSMPSSIKNKYLINSEQIRQVVHKTYMDFVKYIVHVLNTRKKKISSYPKLREPLYKLSHSIVDKTVFNLKNVVWPLFSLPLDIADTNYGNLEKARRRRRSVGASITDPETDEEISLKDELIDLFAKFPISKSEKEMNAKLVQKEHADLVSADIGQYILHENKENDKTNLDKENNEDLFSLMDRSRRQVPTVNYLDKSKAKLDKHARWASYRQVETKIDDPLKISLTKIPKEIEDTNVKNQRKIEMITAKNSDNIETVIEINTNNKTVSFSSSQHNHPHTSENTYATVTFTSLDPTSFKKKDYLYAWLLYNRFSKTNRVFVPNYNYKTNYNYNTNHDELSQVKIIRDVSNESHLKLRRDTTHNSQLNLRRGKAADSQLKLQLVTPDSRQLKRHPDAPDERQLSLRRATPNERQLKLLHGAPRNKQLKPHRHAPDDRQLKISGNASDKSQLNHNFPDYHLTGLQLKYRNDVHENDLDINQIKHSSEAPTGTQQILHPGTTNNHLPGTRLQHRRDAPDQRVFNEDTYRNEIAKLYNSSKIDKNGVVAIGNKTINTTRDGSDQHNKNQSNINHGSGDIRQQELVDYFDDKANVERTSQTGNHDDDDEVGTPDTEDSDDGREDDVTKPSEGIKLEVKGHNVEPEVEFALIEKDDARKSTDYKYSWSEWSECSVSCGIGQRFRSNRCENNLPCTGQSASAETEVCSVQDDC